MQMDDKRLKQLHGRFLQEKAQKANKAIQAATNQLLDLALQCYGPITGQTPNATSQADGLVWYAERFPEFNALLHTLGFANGGLRLPTAQPEQMQRWAGVKAHAHQPPTRHKARERR